MVLLKYFEIIKATLVNILYQHFNSFKLQVFVFIPKLITLLSKVSAYITSNIFDFNDVRPAIPASLVLISQTAF